MIAVITTLQFSGFHDLGCRSTEMESVVSVLIRKVRRLEKLRKW